MQDERILAAAVDWCSFSPRNSRLRASRDLFFRAGTRKSFTQADGARKPIGSFGIESVTVAYTDQSLGDPLDPVYNLMHVSYCRIRFANLMHMSDLSVVGY